EWLLSIGVCPSAAHSGDGGRAGWHLASLPGGGKASGRPRHWGRPQYTKTAGRSVALPEGGSLVRVAGNRRQQGAGAPSRPGIEGQANQGLRWTSSQGLHERTRARGPSNGSPGGTTGSRTATPRRLPPEAPRAGVAGAPPADSPPTRGGRSGAGRPRTFRTTRVVPGGDADIQAAGPNSVPQSHQDDGEAASRPGRADDSH